MAMVFYMALIFHTCGSASVPAPRSLTTQNEGSGCRMQHGLALRSCLAAA